MLLILKVVNFDRSTYSNLSSQLSENEKIAFHQLLFVSDEPLYDDSETHTVAYMPYLQNSSIAKMWFERFCFDTKTFSGKYFSNLFAI